ncbi:MAG TPA: glycosyltransferase [Planctomycetota bacterium]|nr:glycosyltransferase [Planctomycetota bacterium]
MKSGAVPYSLSQRILPETIRADALIPSPEIAGTGKAGEWVASGDSPHFTLPLKLKPGAYQIRLHITSAEARVKLAFFADSGDGLAPRPILEFDHDCGELGALKSVTFGREVRAIRIDIHMRGKFAIQEFALKSLPLPYRFVRGAYRIACAIARPFVRGGRVFWAFGGATQDDLKPGGQIEALPNGNGAWRSLGRDPFFTVAKNFSPGWMRVAAQLESERSGLAQFYWDSGDGFTEKDSVFLSDASGKRETIKYVKLKRPVRALRFDPADVPMDFKLLHFSAQPLSDIRMWLEALKWKWSDMRARRNFGRSLKYGFKLLLNFKLKEFRQKLFPPDASIPQNAYEAWRARHTLTPERRAAMRDEIALWENPPTISVIMPVYNVPEIYLRKAIDSVLNQIYPRWELCIADDKSTAPHIRPILDDYAKKDSRIKVVYREENGHISAASNSALDLATGEFLATLDNDDELAEHALFETAKAIVADPTLDYIYSDEDKIDMTGRHVEPFFKPDWSPELFLSCMYTCHLSVYRASLVRAVGGYRSAFDTAQDYDLVLRLLERTQRVHHLQDILYHWRMLPTSTAAGSAAKPKAHLTAQRSLREHLERAGARGSVEDGPAPGFHCVRFEIIGKPKISIIIPSTCAPKIVEGREINYLERCIQSILDKSTWREFEIIILHRNQMPAEMEARFTAPGIRRVSYSDAFNWSRVNNLGARHASGEHLLFMNDDMEIITPGWLEAMLEFSQQDGIGAVGAKLLFPDGRLQHAGVLVMRGKPGHPYYCFPGGDPGYFFSNAVHRNVLAVTGACMMTRKSVFEFVGGLNEDFPLNYNDVDYCMKLIAAGKRIVYTPHAQLYHYESLSRPKGVEPKEIERFEKLWLARFPDDPYFNPNLTIENSAYIVRHTG